MLKKLDYVPALLIALCTFTLLATTQCAKAHHIATITTLSSHAAIAAVQDTADAVTCGAVTAPVPCLPVEVRKGPVADAIRQALSTDIAVLTAVRQWPGPPTRLDVSADLAKIQLLITNVVNTLPDGAQKTRLLKILGGAK